MAKPRKLKISFKDGQYKVSIPDYDGGEVIEFQAITDLQNFIAARRKMAVGWESYDYWDGYRQACDDILKFVGILES